MSFRITIIETNTERKTVDRWNLLAANGNYGYVPHEEDVIRERTVLLQEIEQLNLAQIIKAINGLE